jgi:hypothetical protein
MLGMCRELKGLFVMDIFGTTARDLAIDALHAATAIYTAEPVVDELLDNINWPQNTARRMADTSCGDGMFLGRALDRLLTGHPSLSDREILNTLEGWKYTLGAATQARATGDRIKVVAGPFLNYEGKVDTTDLRRNQVRVIIDIFIYLVG